MKRKAIKRKELANKFISRENYDTSKQFEQAIEERISIFRSRFHECIIDVRRSNKGAKIIAYKKNK